MDKHRELLTFWFGETADELEERSKPRFPHRNEILNRASTADEADFRADGAAMYGQG